MLLLIVLVVCNVFLGIGFKLFERFGVNNLAAIVVNYFTCVVLATIILGYNPLTPSIRTEPWFPYALGLSITFIIGFNIMALTFQKYGISFTTIVQKMSLVIPVFFVVMFFGESMNALKLLGVVLALLSVVLINFPDKEDTGLSALLRSKWVILPIFTFFVNGMIECVLYYVEKKSYVVPGDIPFVSAIFGLAGILGAIYLIFISIKDKKNYLGKKELIAGIAIGIPNFFTIYLLVLMLSQGWDGSVLFPLNSIGILSLAAIAGYFIFKEHMSRYRLIGLILALGAIFLIAFN